MSRISSRPKNRMLNASRRTKFIASQTKVKKAATGPLRLPWRGWFIAGAPGGAGIGDWGLGIRLHAQRFRQPRIPYPESRLLDRKSVVLGKSVSVRVDLGGRRIITKKKNSST